MNSENKNQNNLTPQTPGPGRDRQRLERPKDIWGTLIRILKTMSDYKLQLGIVAVLMAVSSLSSVLGTYMLRPIINDYIIPLVAQSSPDLSGLIGMLLKMAGIYSAGIIGNYTASRLMVNISSGTLRKIRVGMFEHIQNLPIKYFDTRTHGEIMSHFTNDADTLREMISNSIPNLISSAIMITGVIVMMIILSWQLFLLVILQLILIFFTIKFIGSRSSSYYIKQQRELGSLNGYIEEMIEGQKVVKVFTHENKVKKIFRV